ncbi:MAG: hypothetical protein GEV12_23675 [Micromonosporaceae bacterium]|nr:hypothetical protein [Micromonosporaceae bacterium]
MTAVVAVLLLPAAPALAHGSGGSDATNFASAVQGLATADADRNPVGSLTDPPAVTWRVLANDALLQVANDSGQELLVPGYDGEPYLRVGPQGVWENRNSPAVYLNADRYAQTAVPDGVSAGTDPEWVKVADEPVHAWHDHRIHWMAATLPPQVKADPAVETVVQDWTVPFTLDGRTLAVTGQLRWVPPPTWSPWLVAALAVTSAPLLVALRRPAGAARRRAWLRAAAVVIAVIVVIDAVHTVDDVFAVPATLTQNIVAFAQSAIFIVIAAFGAVKGWRGGDGAAIAVGAGGGALALGIGLTHLATLTSSQVATVLPVAFSRAVVAANLAVIVSAGTAAWFGREPLPDAPATSGAHASGVTP